MCNILGCGQAAGPVRGVFIGMGARRRATPAAGVHGKNDRAGGRKKVVLFFKK